MSLAPSSDSLSQTSTISALVDKLLKDYLVFDGEFEAFTPWWGGNELGYTFYPQPHYPEPKEIIGKTKWTMRTLFGKVPEGLGYSRGDEAMASKVKVTVEPLNVGKKYFDSVPKLPGKLTDVLSEMREIGYSLVFNGYSPNFKKQNERQQRDLGKYKPDYNGLYTLLTIPRFYLRAMGKRDLDELVLLQPMRPGLKIRIRVYSRDKKLAKTFVASMLLTLKYLGVGSAANRGFGRFKLTKVDTTIDEIKVNMEMNELLSILEYNKPGVSDFPRFPLPSEIKKISKVCAEIRGRRYQAKNVEGVLSAIGLATLKSTWKAHCGNLMGSGREYHTWVLGLPRKVKGKGYEGPERRQSYIVISPTENNGVLLLPFYAEDYPDKGIFHKDHGEKEVTDVDVIEHSCSPSQNKPKSTKDYVDVALGWLQELLSC